MTFPSFLLGVIIATLYGALFHLWRGGGLGRLFLYLVLSWFGFWAGHFAASALGWRFVALGLLNLGMATLGSVLFLFVGHWLSQVEIRRQ